MLPHIPSVSPFDFSDLGFLRRLEAMSARERGKIRMMTGTREKGIGIGGGEVTTVGEIEAGALVGRGMAIAEGNVPYSGLRVPFLVIG